MGREATAAAMTYAWEHWETVGEHVDDSVKFVYTDGLRAYQTVPELRDEDTQHE